jgi:hypothetical protein
MDVTFRKRAVSADDFAECRAEVEDAFRLTKLALEGKLPPPTPWPDGVLRSVILGARPDYPRGRGIG